MKTTPKTIKVRITKEHAKKAGPRYFRCESCLFGVVAKAHGLKFYGASLFVIRETDYNLSPSDEQKSQLFYFNDPDLDVVEMPRAERLRRFRPFTVTLRRAE